MGRTILAAVDSSKFMERNVDYACALAKSTESRLTLIHVVVLPLMMEPAVPVDPRPFEEAGSKLLEKAKRIAHEKGAEADTRLAKTFGNPAQEIVKTAEEGKYDLIVIGAKGHSILRNLMIGSVADTVVHNAQCPVVVVR